MVNNNVDGELNSFLEPLTAEKVLEVWSKTYNSQGKPDWSHIYPYYDANIIFQDSIQRLEGISEFKALCRRLTMRCQQLTMEILSIVKDSTIIFFQWKMVMMFRNWPSSPIYGCTRLTLNNEGKIIEQRDYYDIWGDIFNGIPYFRKLYRWFMHKYFG